MVKNPWLSSWVTWNELVLIFEDNDVMLYDSVASAVRSLEPIDVRAGIFAVFLGDGSPGVLTVTASMDPQFGRIELRFHPSDAASRANLAHRLQSWFAATGQACAAVDADELETAVVALRNRIGVSR